MQQIVVDIREVSKNYRLYDSPRDRLKEALHPSGRKYHHNFEALKDVSLTIAENEIVGIVGKNGSGKSTLLKIIANVLQPSSGSISVRDKVTPLLELGSGLNPEYSGVDNIFFYGNILGLGRERIDELFATIVNFADIGEHINQPLKTYSSGMKARLGFSIAVHVDPKILIVDEVLSVGDIAFQRKCYRKMEELFSQGSTVLYVSHNMQSVVQLCNRAILIHNGELLMDDTPDNVVKSYQKLLYEGNLSEDDFSPNKISGGSEQGTPKESQHHTDYFAPGLESQPMIINQDITSFSAIKISDTDDLIVNQLQQGSRYSIEFTASFHRDVAEISFGCQIMTLQGLVLSGANMLSNQGVTYATADKGDSIHVKCEFKCLLVPGSYVVKVFSAPEDGTPASFIEDALIFQVRPQSRANGGYVYLEQSIYAKKILND